MIYTKKYLFILILVFSFLYACHKNAKNAELEKTLSSIHNYNQTSELYDTSSPKIFITNENSFFFKKGILNAKYKLRTNLFDDAPNEVELLSYWSLKMVLYMK